MSIEVKVPKEITEYQEKIMFGLSIRQLISCITAIATVIPSYLILRSLFSIQIAQMVCMVLVAPIWAFGFLKRDGLSFEKYLANILNYQKSKKKRTFETELLIDKIILEEESEEEDNEDSKQNVQIKFIPPSESEVQFQFHKGKKERYSKIKKFKEEYKGAKKERYLGKQRTKEKEQYNGKRKINSTKH